MFSTTTSYGIVWSADPNDERVSISFNADMTTKSVLDKQQKEQKK